MLGRLYQAGSLQLYLVAEEERRLQCVLEMTLHQPQSSRLTHADNKSVVTSGGTEVGETEGPGRYQLLCVRQATRMYCTTQGISQPSFFFFF